VGWVYLDAWESADGVVHFAPDIYDLDSAREESRAKLDGYKP
jgi:murein L,D-transpeptidase YcbB/YkuD